MNVTPRDLDVLFALALEQPPTARKAFLERECPGNPALVRRLEALLEAHAQQSGFLPLSDPEETRTRLAPPPPVPLTEGAGTLIGRYKLLEKLGEGGFGSVWAAEQREPVKRRVALKIIKLGMDTRAVVARFEAERQALALMDHPNIAKVLDAGATENGRPYFVMELVKGISITQYCEAERLNIRQRLELFIRVCQAIQHAHQKGIIHRDIKPSNILVTLHDGTPVPKVIDFGIAKATQQELTELTLYTQHHQFIGTPAYMSPEQAEMSGLDIDTRSDIYSLGVLLYELLTGATPFDTKELMKSGIDAMRRIIREQEPVRPSTRVSQTLQATVGKHSGATPQIREPGTRARRDAGEERRRLAELKGDLDWIAMKCLEKDRTRRYETANGLAADLKRYLGNEPVVARPPSTAYRFQKAWRRNRVTFSAGILVALALVVGIGVSAWQAVQANRARHLATLAKDESVTAKLEALDQRTAAVAARKLAETEAHQSRVTAYASDMNLAKQAIDSSDYGHAMEILDRNRPRPGEEDLRGWEWRFLWQFCRSDALRTLIELPSSAESVVVSSDGKLAATSTGRPHGVTLLPLQGSAAPWRLAEDLHVWILDFHPSRPWLAVAGHNAKGLLEFQLLNVSSGEVLWRKSRSDLIDEPETPNANWCYGLRFLGDGDRLVTCLSGDPVQLVILQTESGAVTKRHRTRNSRQDNVPRPEMFAVTPDGSRCISAVQIDQLEVVDLNSGEQVWSTQAGRDVWAVACSASGKRMAANVMDNGVWAIRIYDLETGKPEDGLLLGHDSWIGALGFMNDDETLLSCGADQVLHVWDLATRKETGRLIGSRQELWSMRQIPGTSRVVTGGKDGRIMLWDAGAPSQSRDHIKLPRTVLGGRIVEGGRAYRTLDETGAVEEWRAPRFGVAAPLFRVPSALGPVLGARADFSPDGDLVAVANQTGTLELWRISDGRKFSLSSSGSDPVSWLGFSGQGDLFAIFGRQKLVRFQAGSWMRTGSWDLELPLRFAGTLSRSGNWAIELAPPDDSNVSARFALHQLDSHSQDEHRGFLGPGTFSNGFTPGFSWDDKWVAIPMEPGLVVVHEVPGMQEVLRFGGHRHGAKSAGFSPDGSRIVSGSILRETVILRDRASGLELLTLGTDNSSNGHKNIGFSADGSLLVLETFENVWIWRAPSGEEIRNEEARMGGR